MLKSSKWIKSPENCNTCPDFYLNINIEKPISRATLKVSALGMYIAYVDGKRVSEDLFTPYCTQATKRIQYQSYDVTKLISGTSRIDFLCAQGWFVGEMPWSKDRTSKALSDHISLIFELEIVDSEGKKFCYVSDENTKVSTSHLLSSQFYDGEVYDLTAAVEELGFAVCDDEAKPELVEQEGEFVREQEVFYPVSMIITPKGERVIDFGQNLSGYVLVDAKGKQGDTISISHAETLDESGNFLTENLRQARQKMKYVLNGERKLLKPFFAWFGFRYIRIDEYIDGDIDLDSFKCIAVYSDMKRTGSFLCGNEKVNQLYHNVIWGQKSNYIDVPTDCPQRDERLGWLGDAQVFARTAAINFDVEKFFRKWLHDIALYQLENNGAVYGICPNVKFAYDTRISAAWGDAATICPWEIYLAYGNREILEEQFESMKMWVDYIHSFGEEEFLWIGGYHYGDWLAMDSDGDEVVTDCDYIASAFFANSTLLLIKAGEVIGKDMTEYIQLYSCIVKAFRKRFIKNGLPTVKTQTAYVLALHFHLTENMELTAEGLANLIKENGMCLSTGFVGTPYLLHALSDNGYAELAYELLFQEKCPSWLYAVNHGATTMWERWDGICSDGTFQKLDLDSFNHYAYGSVFDWLFGVAAGIKVQDDGAGYKHISVRPLTDKRLKFIDVSIQSRYGKVRSSWYYKGDKVFYEIEVPKDCVADILLEDGYSVTVAGGKHFFAKQYNLV